MTPVTVVILNWNGRSLLEKFLPSVVEHTPSEVEILLVDNASSDESISFVKANYPRIKLLELDQNHGFAEGNNRAIPHISTPYFLLLNSDVEVTPNWLEPLVALMDSNDQIASIQPKVKAHYDKDSFEHAGASGGYIDALGYPFCRGRIFDTLEKDQGQHDTQASIFWATGACCLIRKSVVDEIGLFESRFFAHMEEIDFCWRAKNFGYEIMVEPASVVYHLGGGSLPASNPFKTFLNARNSLACMFRNLPGIQVLPKVLFRMMLDGVWGIRAILQGDFGTLWAILRAHLHFYGMLPYLIKYRRKMYAKQSPRKTFDTGVFRGSIVWAYFVKGRKLFLDIIKKDFIQERA